MLTKEEQGWAVEFQRLCTEHGIEAIFISAMMTRITTENERVYIWEWVTRYEHEGALSMTVPLEVELGLRGWRRLHHREYKPVYSPSQRKWFGKVEFHRVSSDYFQKDLAYRIQQTQKQLHDLQDALKEWDARVKAFQEQQ